MSYREGYDSSYGEEPPSEETDDLTVARKTWGGWLFVASLLLGGVLGLLTGNSPVIKGERLDSFASVAVLLSAVIAAALVWRVHQGKGWLAGSLVLVWWAVEVMSKLAGGTLNVGWAIFHIAGMSNFFLGVRACWSLRAEKTANS